MSGSQIGWLVACVGSVCTALLGQAELLAEPWRHVVTIISVITTALSGFMLQRPNPWDGQTDRRAYPREVRMVIEEVERQRRILPPTLPPPEIH